MSDMEKILRIYLSIKSRIETGKLQRRAALRKASASIYPSNQGLKQQLEKRTHQSMEPPHLSIHQIKD